jgi:hypothetical protein
VSPPSWTTAPDEQEVPAYEEPADASAETLALLIAWELKRPVQLTPLDGGLGAYSRRPSPFTSTRRATRIVNRCWPHRWATRHLYWVTLA